MYYSGTFFLKKLNLRMKMRKLFWILVLSLLPFCAFSKVGDLYYCEMTQAIEIKEGKLIKYIPQKFKFRIVNKDLIQFGADSNYFSGTELKIIDFSENGEQFYGDNFEFSFGSFYFAEVFRWPSDDVDTLTATAVSAECSAVEDYSV
jgi:ABC-type branched-subunit amino acid transport system substrate-binding protein